MSNLHERTKLHEDTFARTRLVGITQKENNEQINIEKEKILLMKFSCALFRQFYYDCVVPKFHLIIFVVSY